MPERPNVVVVLCDQLRRQATGYAGDPNVRTPNLDRLAADGVRFTNACSTYPICVPARFSFVTGEYGHTRGMHNGMRMSPGERTVADEFREAGYQTALVGKWHLANWPHRGPPPEAYRGGFEHWRAFEVQNDPFDTEYFAGDDPEPRPLEGYQTDGLFDLGAEFLDENAGSDRPFFLVLSVEPPHPPFTAPEEYLDAVADRPLDLRPNVPHGDEDALPRRHVPPDGVAPYEAWGDTERATDGLYERSNYHGEVVLDEMRAYYAMVENLDDNVGRLLDGLERRGVREETAVVFASDHGEMLGSHGLMMKQHPYEESVGVPFVVSHPGGDVAAGRTVEAPTCIEDWYPTLCGLAGVDPRKDCPGADLSALARGERDGLDRPGVLLEFVHEGRPAMPYAEETWRAFRTERYKYAVLGRPREGGEPWQLFDLLEDPYEQENLVDDPAHEAVARRLHGHLRAALVDTDDDYALAPAFGHDPLHVGG